MRLRITRSGGFVNAPTSVEIDTATASPALAEQSQALLKALDAARPDPAPVPDSYAYTISLPDLDAQNETFVPPRTEAEQLASSLYNTVSPKS
jgi:hypothetical protein